MNKRTILASTATVIALTLATVIQASGASAAGGDSGTISPYVEPIVEDPKDQIGPLLPTTTTEGLTIVTFIPPPTTTTEGLTIVTFIPPAPTTTTEAPATTTTEQPPTTSAPAPTTTEAAAPPAAPEPSTPGSTSLLAPSGDPQAEESAEALTQSVELTPIAQTQQNNDSSIRLLLIAMALVAGLAAGALITKA